MKPIFVVDKATCNSTILTHFLDLYIYLQS